MKTLTKTQTGTGIKVAIGVVVVSTGFILAGLAIKLGTTTTTTDTANMPPQPPAVADVAEYSEKKLIGPVPGSQWNLIEADDFTSDGKNDLLWHNTATGQAVVWKMNGTALDGAAIKVGPAPGAGWKLIGAYDLSGDSKPDLLWQRSTDGQAVVWKMNDTTLDGAGIKVGPAPGSQWNLIEADDFTSDGKNDLLWHNTATGQAVVWKMNGTALDGAAIKVGPAPGAGWKLIGAYDLSGDSKPDLLWQRSTDGQAVVWKMNDTTLDGANIKVGLAPGAEWRLVGADNFTNDSKLDLIFQRSSDGQAVVWKLDGTELVGSGIKIGAAPGAAWKLVGSKDFNKDKKADLLWQNSGDGQAMVLLSKMIPCTDSDGGQDYSVKGVGKGIYAGSDLPVIIGQDPDPNTPKPSPDPYSAYFDYCVDENQLNEAYCAEDGLLNAHGTTCPFGCKDGFCLSTPEASCTDSDGGKNIYVRGMTSYANSLSATDTCILMDNDNMKYADKADCSGPNCGVREYSCEITNGVLGNTESRLACPNGCKGGACLKVENVF